MARETALSLQAAVSASLKEVTPNTDNEKKFVQAQQDYLRQNRETPEQVKARLDRLAADPQALEAHNRSVTNRVTASANPAPANDLMHAVRASQQALQAPANDGMLGALKTEAAVREAEGKTYVVRPGDTLWAIAQRMYGDPYQYKRLFEANPRVLAAPEHIFPGQVLRVPT
jgi:nucleoid-associated protein YgaU